MPQVFKIGSYIVYFWINEGKPLEPIHVHIAEGIPTANGVKVWITQSGKCLLANTKNAAIPLYKLRIILDVIEAQHTIIEQKWVGAFGEITYYC